MTIPLRHYAYHADEPDACFWLTLDHGRTWTRAGGDWLTVRTSDLIAEAHGCNDPEASRVFPLKQWARFHPALRQG